MSPQTIIGITGLFFTLLSVILIPLVVALIRGAMKWTRIEGRLEVIMGDLKELVDEVKEDRKITHERLRSLELQQRRKGW